MGLQIPVQRHCASMRASKNNLLRKRKCKENIVVFLNSKYLEADGDLGGR